MDGNISALHSEYIIDGIPSENCPADMLDECLADPREKLPPTVTYAPIIDETVDPAPLYKAYDAGKMGKYIDDILSYKGQVLIKKPDYAEAYTRRQIAGALIASLWTNDGVLLEDTVIDAVWEWDTRPVGNMAAFYFSTEAAAKYIFDLGVKLRSYSFSESSTQCTAEFYVPSSRVYKRECPETMEPDQDSWLIYIPFDTCPYRLGDSVFESFEGDSGQTAPEVQDPDYFIDCFEIVNELVSDGVIVAGQSVGEGGLALAVGRMCKNVGIDIDLSGIEDAYSEKDAVKILFGETPGVVVQIRDTDYDYIDSQMILQDIAYYPIGHPDKSIDGLKVSSGKKNRISDILASLMPEQ